MNTGTPEREYLVTWEIDILARSPEEAARRARTTQQNPDTWATVFTVAPHDDPGQAVEIDLTALDAPEDTA